MRAVIDTNVLLSALLWRGAPYALLEAVREGSLDLLSSPALLAELARVIRRPKFAAILSRSQTSPEQSLAEIRQLAEIIEPPPLPQAICRDPDDDAVLALAMAGEADCIISSDDDLLTLRHYQGISIIAPAEAIKSMGRG